MLNVEELAAIMNRFTVIISKRISEYHELMMIFHS